MIDFDLSLSAPGEIDVSERIDRDDGTYQGPTTLVDKQVETELSLAGGDGNLSAYGACLRLRIGAFHVKDEKTGRTFHSHAEIELTRADLKRVADFLAFAIANAEERKPDAE